MVASLIHRIVADPREARNRVPRPMGFFNPEWRVMVINPGHRFVE
jgi:hypothetical protein